jgi:hypothetical protein
MASPRPVRSPGGPVSSRPAPAGSDPGHPAGATGTERAVFRRNDQEPFVLEEVARGYTLDDVAACTDVDYEVSLAVMLEACGPVPGWERPELSKAGAFKGRIDDRGFSADG